MKLLFGLICVREYVYRFVLTNAQIEIMAFDLPRVEYNSLNNGNIKTPKMTNSELKECEDDNNRMMREYIEKKSGRKVSLTEYLNGE
ncbi:MAG: hypothetical protein RR319_01350 [Bacteroides sp.]